MQLTRDFSLAEFEQASHRSLYQSERDRAMLHARGHLQPARREFGRLVVTSYVRIPPHVGGGDHADGAAVDVVPLDASIDDVFAWYAARPWLYGQVIHGRDHIHVTLPGTRAKVGEVLRKHADGSYRLGAAMWPILPAIAVLSALVLVAIL